MSFTEKRAITLVRSTFSPYGGVERVTLSVLRGLLHKGVKVTLLTQPDQQWPVADPNLSIVTLGVGYGPRLLQAWRFNAAVSHFVRQRAVEKILSFDRVTLFSHLHAGGGTHKTFLKLKKTYSSALSNFIRKLSLFHRYTLNVEKAGFQNPLLKKIRCNSSLVLRDIRRDYGVSEDKLVVIPSGIRWEAMGSVFDRRVQVAQELRSAHRLDQRFSYLLFLGSGFDRKGLDIAIQGLTVMDANFHLIVVGKGDSQPYQRLATALDLHERVHFAGPQPNGWRYAALCEALILPSQYDPFGGAAAEGHAMGLPVLVSDQTGYSDLIQPAVNGVVLPTPMREDSIQTAFLQLQELITRPRWTAEQLREHARQVDDDLILDRLFVEFIA